MKTKKNLIACIIAIVLICTSYFAGSYIKEQEYAKSRLQRCGSLVSFAIDKVENGDMSDNDTMEALISNVYAAYWFCDEPVLQNQLHNLWNSLIFENNGYTFTDDELLFELHNISDAIKANS